MMQKFRSRTRQALAFAGLTVMLVLVSGCEKQNGIIITYGPIVSGPTICVPNNINPCYVVTKPITEIAMASCIYSIKNTGKDAEDFLFDATYLKPQGGYELFNGDEPQGLKALPNTILVKAGTEAKDVGTVTEKTNVTGMTEDDMGLVMPKFLYKNPQKPNVGVLFVQFPASPTPLWAPDTLFKNMSVPACQGPK